MTETEVKIKARIKELLSKISVELQEVRALLSECGPTNGKEHDKK
jgi:hypothetical protein